MRVNGDDVRLHPRPEPAARNHDYRQAGIANGQRCPGVEARHPGCHGRISLNNTFAGIESGQPVGGGAEGFLVSAESTNDAFTYAAAGAQGTTAVGGAIALAYIENDTVCAHRQCAAALAAPLR
ncbi:MAG: hypothetical protein MZV64_15875 [Ignavibacteriales bacterium]|nr:hypothetical protein [Ignavibacteriales bacterium]